jgi:hypothetical protein
MLKFLNPFRYTMPINENKKNVKICNDNIIKTRKPEYWALKWPIQRGFKTNYTEKLIIATPTNKKTFYGKSIENSKIDQVIQEGVKKINQNISQKWKNTLEFYEFVIKR